ncbi:MAG TPA: TIR domain-containing protein [Candidatus Udaeobacter sp.]|jgi:WD40 repeat protein|nr:TIR domain-containing protein [Candidatus Udaeobacter sp.]
MSSEPSPLPITDANRRAPEAARRSGLLFRLQTFLFGDDIFISYSRADGATYAAGMGDALSRQGFSCKLDLWGTEPGKELPGQLTQALRHSAMLVLVGSQAAMRSIRVAEEVRIFRTTSRPIIPILFGDQIISDAARWHEDVEGLPLSQDDVGALQSGVPSAPIVNRIVKTFTFNTKERRLRLSAQIAAGVLIALLMASVGLGMYASWKTAAAVKASAEAATQNERAARARAEAERQQKIARLRSVSNRLDTDLARDPTLVERAVLVDMKLVKDFQALNEPSVEADRGLRTSLRQLPRFVAQLPKLEGEEALSPDGEFLANGWAWHSVFPLSVWDLATGEKIIESDHGKERINSQAFGMDAQHRARYVATACDDTYSGVWDLGTRKKVAWIKHRAPARVVAFNQDSSLLMTAAADQTLNLWSASDWHKVTELRTGIIASALAFSPLEGTIAAADEKGHVQIWKSKNGTWTIATALIAQSAISKLVFSPDGKGLLALNEFNIVSARLYDASTGQLKGQLTDEDIRKGEVSFATDSDRFFLATRGIVRALKWDSGREERLTTEAGVGGSFVSMDGRYFGTLGNREYSVRILDTQNGQPVATIVHPADRFPRNNIFAHIGAVKAAGRHVLTSVSGQYVIWENPVSLPDRQYRHERRILWIAVLAGGTQLGTSSSDGLIRVWDTRSGAELFSFLTPNDQLVEPNIRAVAFETSGDLIASVNWSDIFVVERSTGKVVAQKNFFEVYDLAFDPDGRYLAAGGSDGLVVWATDTWQPINVGKTAGHVLKIEFSPKGTFVATVTSQGERATVWRTGTGDVLQDMKLDGGNACIAFSDDERLVGITTAGGTRLGKEGLVGLHPTVLVKKLDTGEELLRFQPDTAIPTAIAFSPDRKHLVVASGAQSAIQHEKLSVKVWRLADGQEATSLDHVQSVSTIAFARAGQLMVTGGRAGVTRVWDTRTWQQIAQLESVKPLQFSPVSVGGQYVATLATDLSAQTSTLDTSELIVSGCGRVARELTPDEWRTYFGTETPAPLCPKPTQAPQH